MYDEDPHPSIHVPPETKWDPRAVQHCVSRDKHDQIYKQFHFGCHGRAHDSHHSENEHCWPNRASDRSAPSWGTDL